MGLTGTGPTSRCGRSRSRSARSRSLAGVTHAPNPEQVAAGRAMACAGQKAAAHTVDDG